MAWEPHWGISSWGYKIIGPRDIDSLKQTILFVNQDLQFPKSSNRRVIEIFASMGEEGHAEDLEAGREMRKIAEDNNIILHACGFNPFYLDPVNKIPSPHLTSRDTKEQDLSIGRIHRGIEHAVALAKPGAGLLMAPSYMRHSYFGENEQGLYPGERDLFVKLTKERIAPFARDRGATVAYEPMNRFEGYLLVPGEDSISFIKEVDEKSIRLNVGTVHWQMEAEGSLEQSLKRVLLTGYVADLHLEESQRKKWGSGDIGSRAELIYRTIIETEYSGPVVQEDFCPALHTTLKIWRPEKLSVEEVIKFGVNTTSLAYNKIYESQDLILS
jgi:sugar phosphate isomerase/epimerase